MSQIKPNIFAFIGQNIPQRDKTLGALVEQFSSKHGVHNVLRVSGSDIPADIYQHIQSSGLFSEKKLFIFALHTEKKGGKTPANNPWDNLLKTWGDEHLLVFLIDILDTKKPLHQLINTYANKKTFILPVPSEIADYIQDKLPQANNSAVQLLANLFPCYEQKYGKFVYIPNSLEMLSHALMQLSIYKPEQPITTEDVHLISPPSALQNDSFEFLDTILYQPKEKTLQYALNFFEKNGGSYGVSSLLGIVRKILYTQALLKKGVSADKICEILDAKPFYVQKAAKQLPFFSRLHTLYSELLRLQIKSRKGELKDEEIYLLFVQKTICSLSNS